MLLGRFRLFDKIAEVIEQLLSMLGSRVGKNASEENNGAVDESHAQWQGSQTIAALRMQIDARGIVFQSAGPRCTVGLKLKNKLIRSIIKLVDLLLGLR